jgi:hypothetical protein
MQERQLLTPLLAYRRVLVRVQPFPRTSALSGLCVRSV